jgi:hypothetical protein
MTLADASPAVCAATDVPPRNAADSGVDSKLLIVDLCGGLGVEFAAWGSASTAGVVVVSNGGPQDGPGARLSCAEFIASPDIWESTSGLPGQYPFRLVIFLPSESSESIGRVVDRCVALAASHSACLVCLVSSLNMVEGSDELSEFEKSVVSRFENVVAKTVVLRTGRVVDPIHRWPLSFANRDAWYPLVPESVASVFLSRAQLFAAVDRAGRGELAGRCRRLIVLGTRRALREVLAEFFKPSPETDSIPVLATLLSWLQVGRLANLVLSAASRFYRPLQRWRFSTLNPRSTGELLRLYHPLNQNYIALAGYNTGVVHFGWKYPGRTVVRTTGSGRLVRVGERTVTADAGVLLKRVIQELAARGKELYVVPNYSYVSLGTTFMVPVHGSGSEVSTLGETIEEVLVYDPATDRIVKLRRDDERFGRWLYNPSSGILVLRLKLRVRDKSRYFVKCSELTAPAAAQIWQTFADPEAANIELRKTRAADDAVSVRKYYTTSSGDADTMEIPRDKIGRIWDRLEENAVTSWLFHTYVRKCGFHVELFLDEPEFEVFWGAHANLPLSKIQLRLVKRDGLPSSPFGDRDRISIDIFMKRRDSVAFLSFMKEHLPHARFNPGKHSM